MLLVRGKWGDRGSKVLEALERRLCGMSEGAVQESGVGEDSWAAGGPLSDPGIR